MPLYKTATIPTAVYWGDTFPAINVEASTLYPTGTAAERCAIPPNVGQGAKMISLQLEFSANPGAFRIDLQTADSDITGAFITPSASFQVTTAAQTGGTGSYYARIEVTVKALLARVFVFTQTTNACNITASITG